MEWIIGIVVFICITAYIAVRQRIQTRRERLEDIKNKFGNLDVSDCTKEHLVKLKEVLNYYDCDLSNNIYDDYNVDQLFLKLDATHSAVGEEYLYYTLHNPKYDYEAIRDRHIMSDELSELEDTIDLRYKLSSIKKYKNTSVIACINNLKNVDANDTLFHIISLLMFVASFVLMFIIPSFGVFSCLIIAAINSVTYFIKKDRISGYINAMLVLVLLIDTARKIKPDVLKNTDENNKSYKLINDINLLSKRFDKFTKNAWLIAPKSEVESIVEILTDYLKFLTHLDIIKFNISVNNLKNYEKELSELYSLFGELELVLNIASIKKALPYYVVPEFDDNIRIDAKDMYHPLLNEPVANDCITSKPMLITGSNASGKSTYLRMIGINALLSQTLGLVCAKSYKSCIFKFASSMKITDNILEGESFYMAEIKHIKEILDYDESLPLLVCIDEILRGTNTLERVSASSQILKYMSGKKTLVIAATHDIELVELLEGVYDNYYFCENIDDSDNIFDYKIRSGINYTNNAIKLLERCGYPQEIVKGSFELCEQLKS